MNMYLMANVAQSDRLTESYHMTLHFTLALESILIVLACFARVGANLGFGSLPPLLISAIVRHGRQLFKEKKEPLIKPLYTTHERLMTDKGLV